MIQINKREWYDFEATVDIMIRGSGSAGIAFRVMNPFNYYALYINKSRGYKAIIKVVNGIKTELVKLSDGGILVNDWHTVRIHVSSNHITINVSDVELGVRSVVQTMKTNDSTFSRGSIGLFINGMDAFYFDNLEISPQTCWTPWIPQKNIEIEDSNSSIYEEDFKGTFDAKYTVIDPESASNAPSVWKYSSKNSIAGVVGIKQASQIFDNSPKRKPSILLLKNKTLSNGVYTVAFYPDKTKAIISIIFKYSKAPVNAGRKSISFYSLELINDEKNGQVVLRKFVDNIATEIKSIPGPVNNVPGLIPNQKHEVQVECVNDKIIISLGVGGKPFSEIMSVTDNSITRGQVGFGTYGTTATFTKLDIFPPKMYLSEADKSLIMKIDTDEIPIPTSTLR